jgi:GH25 family lysozyme M1 (1,4-beta-N-acetylmuramidase)
MSEFANVFDASAYQEFYIQHGASVAAGFRGGIFRASIGTLRDGTFKYNMDREIAAGGLAGAYHFWYTHRPAVTQAEVFWDQIEPYWPLSLLSWGDAEKRSNVVGKLGQRAAAGHFMVFEGRFKELAGVTFDGMYTSASAFQFLFGDKLDGAHEWKLGVAHYTTRPEPFLPAPWRIRGKPYWWWQFAERGRVSWYRQGTRDLDLGRIRSADLGPVDPVDPVDPCAGCP